MMMMILAAVTQRRASMSLLIIPYSMNGSRNGPMNMAFRECPLSECLTHCASMKPWMSG